MDSSIIETNKFDDNVTNGRAFEKATLPLSGIKTLEVPATARVETKEAIRDVLIFLQKNLHFKGHPPAPMDIRTASGYMGVAYQKEKGTRLRLATFGEFSTKEGGADLTLVIQTPARLQVTRSENTSGEHSEAQGPEANQEQLSKCYWYGPAAPRDGWTIVPTSPDPGKHAQ